MKLDPHNGWLLPAIHLSSPNHDSRPHPGFINGLIIHAISLPPEHFGNEYVEQFFCNKLNTNMHPYFCEIADLRVSAHFYIKRDGQLIQFVSTSQRAWHAGISCLNGLDAVNDFSIGIELEGCDTQQFESAQYQQLLKLSRCLMQAYPAIRPARIKRHSDIAPGRKTDPGPGFDWNRYLDAI